MIEVKIPYSLDGKLADAYNEAMQTATSKWVLLLDHDVFLATTPYWNLLLEKTIEKVEKNEQNVGIISCVTSGRQTGDPQKSDINIESTDIENHMNIAKELYYKYGDFIKKRNVSLAGFFMLVNKDAWREIPFRSRGKGVNKIDKDFSSRILKAGYDIWILPGLYVYHKTGIRKLKW